MKIFKTEGKKPIVRLRSEWENNIEMDLKEVGWSGIDWFSGKKPIVRLRSEWENNIEMDLKEVGWSGIDWFSGSLLKR